MSQSNWCVFCHLAFGSQEPRVGVGGMDETLFSHLHCYTQYVERKNFSNHPVFKEMVRRIIKPKRRVIES